MPQKLWVPGEEVVDDDINDYLQNQVVPQFTSTAQRASQWPAPPDGALCVCTDTNTLFQYIGGAWYGGGVLSTVQGTANVTGNSTTVTIITTGSLVIPTGRKIQISYSSLAALTSGAGQLNAWELVRTSTVIQTWQHYISPGTAGNNEAVAFTYVDSPSAGTYTYLVRWATTVTTAGVDVATSTFKRQLVVTDLGP
jgi:hypothetical protein